jgi:L-asparaginase
LTRVHIIGTGGTIASRSGGTDDRGDSSGQDQGSIASVTVADLVGSVRAASELEVTTEDLMTIGSYRLGLPEILEIATAAIARAADPAVDGVVVTHGTDTLEETAFLTELVNDSGTTVVFTGAQRAADMPDTDGPRNLRQAVAVAADPRFCGMGSLVSFDGRVQSARGARKAHTIASQPFDGGVTVGLFRGDELDLVAGPERRRALPLPGAGFRTARVDIVTAYPGSDPEILRHAAANGAVGVVLAGTGVGNAGPGYSETVAELVRDGIPVVLASRVPTGPVVPIYGLGGGVDLIAAGAVGSGQLNPFQARILAAHLLSANPSVTEFTTLFSALR